MKSIFGKQKYNRKLLWLGALKVQYNATMSYMGIPNQLLLAIAAIATIQKWFPWVSFYLLLGMMAAGFLLLALFHYYIIQPVEMAYNSKQGWKHNNPAQQRIDSIDKKVTAICEKLGIEEEK